MPEKELSLTLVLLKQYKDMFLISFKFIPATINYFLFPQLATCNIVSVKPIYVFIPGGDIVVGSESVTVKNI